MVRHRRLPLDVSMLTLASPWRRIPQHMQTQCKGRRFGVDSGRESDLADNDHEFSWLYAVMRDVGGFGEIKVDPLFLLPTRQKKSEMKELGGNGAAWLPRTPPPPLAVAVVQYDGGPVQVLRDLLHTSCTVFVYLLLTVRSTSR